MTTFRTVTSRLFIFAVIAVMSTAIFAQAPPITAPGASIAVRIAMDKEQVPLGQRPIATLTIWNTSDHVVFMTNDPLQYGLHPEGKNGEPSKTMWYRQILERGLNETNNVSVRVAIWPADFAGNSTDVKFTLSAFYDLDVAGQYTVYLEAWDESGKKLLRTNTVQFEMQAPKQ